MRLNLLLPTLLALTLGAALADEAAPSTPSPFSSSLKQLASSGTVITLLADVGGQATVVATVNPDGTLNVTGDLQSATSVRVGDVTYTLAARVTGGGTLFVTTTTAQGTTLTLPLVAAIHRAAAAAKADAAPHGPATVADAEQSADTDLDAAKRGLGTPAASTGATNAAAGMAAAASGSGHAKTPPAPEKPPKAPPAAGGHR